MAEYSKHVGQGVQIIRLDNLHSGQPCVCWLLQFQVLNVGIAIARPLCILITSATTALSTTTLRPLNRRNILERDLRTISLLVWSRSLDIGQHLLLQVQATHYVDTHRVSGLGQSPLMLLG